MPVSPSRPAEPSHGAATSVHAVALLLLSDLPSRAERIHLALDGADAWVVGRPAVDVVPRVDAALARLAQGGVDAVLLDLAVGDPSWRVALDRLRSAAPEVPVIALAASADGVELADAVQRGAVDCLPGPEPHGGMLARAVRHAVDRARVETRYHSVLRMASVGFWMLSLDGRILEVNDAYCAYTGYSRPELLAMRVHDVAVAKRPEDVARRIAAAVEHGAQRIETRHRRRDGSIVDLEASIHYSRMDGGRLCAFFHDITERRSAEERLRSNEALLRAVTTVTPLGLLVARGLDEPMLYFNSRFCEIWGLGHLEAELRDGTLTNGDALQVALRQVRDVPGFLEAAVRLLKEEDRGTYEDEIEFWDGRIIRRVSTQIRDAGDRFVGRSFFFEDVTARRRTEASQRLLADATAVLDSSLDSATMLERVARLAIPTFADACLIDLLEDGVLRRVAIAHVDPRKEALLEEEQRRYPVELASGRISAGVVRAGEPLLIPEVTADFYAPVEQDRAHAELVRAVDARSVIVTPLIARGMTLGAMGFVITESARRYGADDLRIAVELARRAALALDNARLHSAARAELTERRAAEAALQASEERYRLIVEGSTEVFFYVHDLDRRWEYLSPSVLAVLGYAPDELLGERYDALLVDDPALTAADPQRGNRTIAVRHRDGRPLYLELVESPVLRDGVHCATRGFARDVTTRVRAEQALRASEERHRLVTRATNDLIYDWDIASGRLLWSDAIRTVFRYAADAVGSDIAWWSERVHPADRTRVEVSLQETLDNSATVWSEEYRFRRGDGSYATVLERGYVLRSESGAPLRMIGAMSDVTERKVAEDALLRSEASFRSFVQNSPLGVCRTAADGRLLTVNPAMVRMLGYASAEELQGVNLASDIYLESADRERAVARLGTPDSSATFEARWRRKDGRAITVRITTRPYHDERGTLQHLESFVEDVTPLRAAELALRQSERLAAVGQLISGVAHELNNPLSAVLLHAETLLLGTTGDGRTESIATILAEAQRARTVVRDLLATAQGTDARRTRVDTRELLDGAAEQVRPQVTQLGTRLDVVLPDALPPLVVDAPAITRLVGNLLLNGAQSTGKGGLVRLIAHQRDDVCEIVVEDDAPLRAEGAPPRVLGDLTERMETEAETRLGVAVSLLIAQQHGGTLTVERRPAPEGGGRIVVTLPLVPAGDGPDALPSPTGDARLGPAGSVARPGT